MQQMDLTGFSCMHKRCPISTIIPVVLQGRVRVQQMDLADLSSVRAAASALQRLPRIDFLILNAGIMVGPALHTTLQTLVCAKSGMEARQWHSQSPPHAALP